MSTKKDAILAPKIKPVSGLLLDWLPGETLYSLLARIHQISGRKKAIDTINDLFGMAKDRILSADRTEIDCFVERTGGALGTAQEILAEHTILRYYLPFLRQRTRRLIPPGKFSSVGMLKFPLGLQNGMFWRLYPLKGCRVCVEADKAKNGMPYWRLEHQLPGVWVCLEHSLPLYCTSDIPAPSDRFHWVVPALEQFAELPKYLDNPGSISDFRSLAEFVVSVTTRFHRGQDPIEDIRQRFFDFAESTGLLTDKGKLRGCDDVGVATLSRRLQRFMSIFSGTEEFRALYPTYFATHNLLLRFLSTQRWLTDTELLLIAAWIEIEQVGV